MATITASMVNDLRARTGLGMMECKKMLTETAGDVDKAIEAFRKKGVKTSITARAANEGRVAVGVSADHKTAAAVEINCNTDFTAKSDAVAQIADLAVSKLLSGAAASEDAQVKAKLTEVAQQTGENVQLGRTATLKAASGRAGGYLYVTAGKGKIAVLVSFSGNASDEDVRNLGMHIAAARPIARTRQEVPADLVAKEREIAVEQAKASGKPQPIAEKIAEGKLNAFFAERVLLDQDFINPEAFKGKVSDYLKQKGLALETYARLEVGQAS
jgi:elongation factor Ts